MARSYNLTKDEALDLHKLVADHNIALKNWIASAVERGDFDRASEMVDELRRYEALFAKLNVKAHDEIDAICKR